MIRKATLALALALSASPALADTETVSGSYASRCYEVSVEVTRNASIVRLAYLSWDPCTHQIYAAGNDIVPRLTYTGRVNDNLVQFDFVFATKPNFNAWGGYRPTEFHLTWRRDPAAPYEIERGTETGRSKTGIPYSRPFLNVLYTSLPVEGDTQLVEPPTSRMSGTMRSSRP